MYRRTKGPLPRLICPLLIAASLAAGGCSGERETSGTKERYRLVEAEAVALYLDMHPLRGSSLGRTESDSLLYTYSADEVRASLSRLSDLEQELKTIGSAGLDTRRLENSRLLLSWIRGERFGLKELQYHRTGPLLYCWMLEEALWSIPLRSAEPYGGELEAYEKRRLRIPALLENAARNTRNPARPHIELASQRLRRLIGNLPQLDAALRRRYGRVAALPDSVARSMTGFLGFLEGTLSSQTRGNTILGTENIAKIFRYGEMIDLDPAGMIDEAEKQIRSLRSELSSLRRGAPPPRPGAWRDPAAIIARVREPGAGAAFTKQSPPEIGLSPGPVPRSGFVKNVNLGIPAPDPEPVRLISTTVFSAGPCVQSLRYEEKAKDDPRFLYRVLRALSTMETERRLCVEGDTTRTLLGSDLYPHMVGFLEIDALIDDFPDERHRLRVMLAEEKIRALARMTVLLEIHAGTMTTGAAIDYLSDAAAMNPEDAASEVMAATYAPSSAHPGIALIYIDRMIKKAAEKRDSTPPARRVLQTLRKHPYLPPAMVIDRLES